jgi:uncharacterized protein YigE (DUF2233 family)
MRRLLAAAILAAAAPGAQAAEVASGCRNLDWEGQSYTICEVGPDADLRLFHAAPDGVLGSFAAVDAYLGRDGGRLAFGMNAGMYHSDRSPVGLFVENGRRVTPLVTRDGPGNFGLLPNGVFCIRPGDGQSPRFAVMETRAFASLAPECTYATQSGPMLVIDGALHPRFLPDSTSRNIRNGVGVSRDGQRAVLAISDRKVTFHSFARFFRDALNLPDALYLDGSISRLYAPDIGRDDPGFPMGPIVGLVVPRV